MAAAAHRGMAARTCAPIVVSTGSCPHCGWVYIGALDVAARGSACEVAPRIQSGLKQCIPASLHTHDARMRLPP